ncbi:MAG: class I SAM-dependent methyltransferase, partial [Rubrivivax sp.]
GYRTDKSASFLAVYEGLFAPLRNQPVAMLELGIHHGGSLLMWRDYFAQGVIAGLDQHRVQVQDASGRIRVYQGDQQDAVLLDRIAAETAPGGFDIVIDDASHFGRLSRATFDHLFHRHLKPGGLYIIEDWGTGYWPSWPDGSAWRAPREWSPPRWLTEPVALLPVPGLRALHFQSLRVARRLARGLWPGWARRPLASHQSGMVGFVKQLVDECAWGDVTYPGLGVASSRQACIESISFHRGQCVVRKSASAHNPGLASPPTSPRS